MSPHKKKPVQYFFVDINDPDYYKRIKVARACIDCRKRKSKCDIGKPGSGACSSCRKHNKTCEFTATATTILSSSVPNIVSSSSSSSNKPYTERKKNQQQSAVVNEKIKIAPSSFQTETDFHWPPHQLTLIPFMVPESKNNTNTTDASQFTVTQEDNHLVGHLRFNLPVRCEQQEHENLPAVTLLSATTPPLVLSSHSTTTTPSPPLDTNHACDATFPWKTSKSSVDVTKKEIFMRSVSPVDPLKNDHHLLTSSSPFTYEQQHQALLLPSELDLLKLYFDRIHPSYPALPKTILELRQGIPFCLRYAIMALSLLHYQHQTDPIPTLARDYYNKACKMIQSRGTNDLVSAQTLLLLYKYHETIGQVKPSLLESTQAILEQQQQQQQQMTSSSFGDDEKEEWICRLFWLVYLHQFNSTVTTTTWRDLPMIRLPCLLPYEEQDKEQQKVISQFLDSIHTACVYSSAMQNLAIDDDPWSCITFHNNNNNNNIDSSPSL